MSAKMRQTERRILTPAEKESLNERVRNYNEDRTATANTYIPERVNDPLERASIERAKRVLREGEPDSLSQNNKKILEETAKRDKEWMQKSMVPKSHINLRPGTDDTMFRKCVNEMAQKENSPEFQKVAQRYKNAMRTLHPSDPHLANLETIRPESR